MDQGFKCNIMIIKLVHDFVEAELDRVGDIERVGGIKYKSSIFQYVEIVFFCIIGFLEELTELSSLNIVASGVNGFEKPCQNDEEVCHF